VKFLIRFPENGMMWFKARGIQNLTICTRGAVHTK